MSTTSGTGNTNNYMMMTANSRMAIMTKVNTTGVG